MARQKTLRELQRAIYKVPDIQLTTRRIPQVQKGSKYFAVLNRGAKQVSDQLSKSNIDKRLQTKIKVGLDIITEAIDTATPTGQLSSKGIRSTRLFSYRIANAIKLHRAGQINDKQLDRELDKLVNRTFTRSITGKKVKEQYSKELTIPGQPTPKIKLTFRRMMKWQGKVEDYDFYRENREKIVTFNHIKKTQGEQAAQKYAEESGLDEEWNIWKVKKAEREAELNKAIDEKLDNPDGEME